MLHVNDDGEIKGLAIDYLVWVAPLPDLEPIHFFYLFYLLIILFKP